MIVTDSRTVPLARLPPLGRIAVTTVLAEPLLCRDRLAGILPAHHEDIGAPSPGLTCRQMTEETISPGKISFAESLRGGLRMPL